MDLLPIGQFARLSRLSVKQLRHYADLGLLPPAHVDDDTGYRYYHPSQARQAMSIGLLRSLDVPLAVIAQVLSGTAGALGQVRDDLDSELRRRRRTLAALEKVMADGLPSAQVRMVEESARLVAVTSEQAADDLDVGRATSACVARLLAARLQHAHLQQAAPRLIGLFPVDLNEPLTVEVALESDAPVTGTTSRLLPGGRFAQATHIGPYDQISLTAHALLSWCAERNHPVHGPLREVYASDPATTPADQLITHLQIPLEEDQ
ncbi:MerR family transcriptional regulator [Nonomuraea dietziae]|uniref:DNA-binding transcriptional MerR regulator n=1 Tax=Nonomuraea dietziae TaxID=65515 RepID=A0A7W5V200_9ACTN|nr:GyrI-like domain-containing protein [Nonomuraea dietziae]MBB3724993.1 DNA-binding transcriptional MerR regulator [Nonomuraea dietziae]